MNRLKNEISPYLLQHANNPVDWHPWNKSTLAKAKNLNKPLLISIGYSACHWCHVMAHESFEDEGIAKIMNTHFLCIKIDREERPDIDQIYMEAIQMLTGSGGWPLNCFALPNGKPFWGGTYFSKDRWIEILKQINAIYSERFYSIKNQADDISKAINQNNLLRGSFDARGVSKSDISKLYSKLSEKFDYKNGGDIGAPKFPMPSVSEFVLNYYYHTNDNSALEHLENTLKKMATGGIFDQLGGGFCRYSTDDKWKIPHFEKMLYDNAQLVSLYSKFFKLTRNDFYRKIVEKTLSFIEKELTGNSGEFFTALDADSEGEEGKYYVWEYKELQEIISSNWFYNYYQLQQIGNWENGKNILHASYTIEDYALMNYLDIKAIGPKLEEFKSKLLNTRNRRTKPGIDYKTITSWNAMMCKAYIDAYIVTDEDKYLQAALRNMQFILRKLISEEGELFHVYGKGRASVSAFLEDYSFLVEAMIALYTATLDEKWLYKARLYTNEAIYKFYDSNDGLFFFTQFDNEHDIARKKDLYDNVVPSSNSSILRSILLLGAIFEDANFLDITDKAVKICKSSALDYPSAYSNMGNLLIENAFNHYTVVVTGDDSIEIIKEAYRHFLPNLFFIQAKEDSSLTIAKNKYSPVNQLFACDLHNCKPPVASLDDLLDFIIA